MATDSNLYIKFENKNMIIVGVYVDDIIFGSDLQIMSVNFASDMKKEFQMSLLGEWKFLALQVSQSDKGIFISQTKYIKHMLKKFKMEDSKPVSTPMVTSCKLRKDDESLEVNHTKYRYMIWSTSKDSSSFLNLQLATIGVLTWLEYSILNLLSMYFNLPGLINEGPFVWLRNL